MKVRRTEEFERILALPRRLLNEQAAKQYADQLTPMFSLSPECALRPWQAISLVEALQCGGAFLALPVGQGKTLISALLPLVFSSKSPLLVVPGSLRDKTLADFEGYRGKWRLPNPPIHLVTKEGLSVESGATILDDYKPDLIILDESDGFSNTKSSAVRRLDRYILKHDCSVVAMTGTPARKSMLDYWHILAWCLGDGAPVPLSLQEATVWAGAIDLKTRSFEKVHPGPLGSTLNEARAWYSQRLISCPGVVIIDEDSCDAPLTIRQIVCDEDPVLDAAFEQLLTTWESPGGIPVSDPLSCRQLEAQIGLGFYTQWDPDPPEEWRNARKAFARFVRDKIEASTYTDRPMDTEAQVARRYQASPVVKRWKEVKGLFDGRTKTTWISQSTVNRAARWLKEVGGPAIIWTGSVEFGRAFSDMTGVEYFGEQGVGQSGARLHAETGSRAVCASWHANKKGLNLQGFSRQLIVLPPSSAKWIEQLIGRSHRAGQEKDVDVDILISSGVVHDMLVSAFEEAKGVKGTVAMTQKILRASILWAEKPASTNTNLYRWTTKSQMAQPVSRRIQAHAERSRSHQGGPIPASPSKWGSLQRPLLESIAANASLQREVVQ